LRESIRLFDKALGFYSPFLHDFASKGEYTIVKTTLLKVRGA